MRIFDRVTRLLRSDAHGILDQLEERSLLLKQNLRDAELLLEAKRARAQALEEEQRRLRQEAERLRTRERSLDDDVELALGGGKPELARFAVGRLLPVREARRECETRIGEVGAERDRLCERLEAQEAQLAALRTRVRARLAEHRREPPASAALGRSPAEEEIDLELLRRGASASTEPASATRGEA